MSIEQKIIPAINNHKNLRKFLTTDLEYGILMNFQLSQLEDLVNTMRENKKKVLIHAELIKGLSSDEYGAIYLIQKLKVDGIVSSKPRVIELCKKRNVTAIFRFFLKDTMSLEQSILFANKIDPDYLEILPSSSISMIDYLKPLINSPLLFGGLIREEAQVRNCISMGAKAITTSCSDIWDMRV